PIGLPGRADHSARFAARSPGTVLLLALLPVIAGFAVAASGRIRRPRPPRLTWPPLRPALRASSAVHSWAVPFSCAARPPLLAISRCFSGDIDAKPRRSLRSVLTGRPSVSLPPLHANRVRSLVLVWRR